MTYRNPNKFKAIRQHSDLIGRTFDSKAECEYAEILWKRQKAGEISQLEFQVRFDLSTRKHNIVFVKIDFVYVEKGIKKYVDLKGRNSDTDRDFRVKVIWLYEKTGIEVELVYRRAKRRTIKSPPRPRPKVSMKAVDKFNEEAEQQLARDGASVVEGVRI